MSDQEQMTIDGIRDARLDRVRKKAEESQGILSRAKNNRDKANRAFKMAENMATFLQIQEKIEEARVQSIHDKDVYILAAADVGGVLQCLHAYKLWDMDTAEYNVYAFFRGGTNITDDMGIWREVETDYTVWSRKIGYWDVHKKEMPEEDVAEIRGESFEREMPEGMPEEGDPFDTDTELEEGGDHLINGEEESEDGTEESPF